MNRSLFDCPALSSTMGVLLIACSLTASADDWLMVTPPAPEPGTGSTVILSQEGLGLSSEGGYSRFSATQPGTRHRADLDKQRKDTLTLAFRKKMNNGKLGRVISALGLESIYNEPMVRNVLGRVQGSRFCLTGGCGINLKMSLRKPGLRFEHHF